MNEEVKVYNLYFKRWIDLTLSCLSLPLQLLVLIFVAPAVFFDDRGPLFYVSERRGKDGKPFKMYKYRSMRAGAPELRAADRSFLTLENDSRLTRVGRFLRKSSLDELPQLINVLRGEMSLIGPRPNMNGTPYAQLTETERRRIAVKPGLTGYTQAFFRNSITTEEKYRWDVYYAEHVSFRLDCKIFFRTILSVLSQKNIYAPSQETPVSLSSPDGTEEQRNRGTEEQRNRGTEEQRNRGTEEQRKGEQMCSISKLLILGGSSLQVPMILRAREEGFRVGVVDMNPAAPGASLADDFFPLSTTDIEGTLALARDWRPCGVTTIGTDLPVRCIARIARELNLPGLSEQAAYLCTDKGAMREALSRAGVPCPAFRVLRSGQDLRELSEHLSYPIVVKPADSSGSRGVQAVEDEDELHAAYLYALHYSPSKRVIAEEFLAGKEVSVEMMAWQGDIFIVAVTDKQTGGAPHFVESGHCQPSRLPLGVQEEIHHVAKRAARALGIENGAGHIELMCTEDGVKVIEAGHRLGGDYITSHLVPLSTGIDIVKATIQTACGRRPDLRPTQKRAAAVRFFSGCPGVIKALRGIEEVRSWPGVVDVFLFRTPGERIRLVTNSAERTGAVLVKAEDAAAAEALCDKALRHIRVEVEEDEK